MTTPGTYGKVAQFLHWVIALLIIGMIGLGWVMGDVPRDNPIKFPLYQLHKSIGITILFLSLFRLYWRIKNPPPPLPAGMKPWEEKLARTVVVLFYVLMIGMPLTGWALVSASPYNIPTMLFGVIPWPHLPVLSTMENKGAISEFFEETHEIFANLIIATLVLHIGAALKHHFINRDDVLLRMLPHYAAERLRKLRGG